MRIQQVLLTKNATRRTIVMRSLHIKNRIHASIKRRIAVSIDCITAFSFGSGDGRTSHANMAIRTQILASDFVHKAPHPPPLIAQGELAGEFFSFNSRMIPAHIITESHSYRAAREAYATMNKYGWKTCVIAAHGDRIALHVALMQKQGAVVAGTIAANTYDDRAKEFFFRSRLAFRIYRFFEMRRYTQKGWI